MSSGGRMMDVITRHVMVNGVGGKFREMRKEFINK